MTMDYVLGGIKGYSFWKSWIWKWYDLCYKKRPSGIYGWMA